MIVYIDVLFVVNFMIDFIMVRLASLFAGMSISAWRCALGAFIGAMSSLIIFVPEIGPAALLLFKIAVCAVMAAVSFMPVRLKKMPVIIFLLCAVSFIMSGIFTFMANSFLHDRMSVYRGTVYFDIGLPAMLLSVTFAYAAVRLLSAILKSKTPLGADCTLTVATKYGSCTIDALIDTGCGVTEPFSGEPVIVCDSRLVSAVIPSDFFEGRNFRLVPFRTINSTGMLKAFRSDYVIIKTERERYRCEGVFVAVGELDSCVMINPAVLNNAEREGALTI